MTIDPTWLTPSALALAQSAYEHRALPAGTLENDRLGILADALEDAGCMNQDILTPLRKPGEYSRGFWPLDLLLGKS